MRYMKGRIYGSFDYYNKNTSDILFQTTAIQPAPSSIYLLSICLLHLINSGVEFGIGAALIEKQGLYMGC